MKYQFLIALCATIFVSCIGEDVFYPEEFDDNISSDTSSTVVQDTSIEENGDTTITYDTVLIERTCVLDDSYTSDYKTKGTVKLVEQLDGSLTLEFQSDADIGDGPSLYIMLTNTLNIPFSIDNSGNTRIVNQTSAQISFSKLEGAFTGERVYSVPEGVEIEDYKFVTFYCTLGAVFGYGELN